MCSSICPSSSHLGESHWLPIDGKMCFIKSELKQEEIAYIFMKALSELKSKSHSEFPILRSRSLPSKEISDAAKAACEGVKEDSRTISPICEMIITKHRIKNFVINIFDQDKEYCYSDADIADALRYYVRNGSNKVVEVFLNHSRIVISSNVYGALLVEAAEKGHLAVVQLLDQHPKGRGLSKIFIFSALVAASSKDHEAVVAYLISMTEKRREKKDEAASEVESESELTVRLEATLTHQEVTEALTSAITVATREKNGSTLSVLKSAARKELKAKIAELQEEENFYLNFVRVVLEDSIQISTLTAEDMSEYFLAFLRDTMSDFKSEGKIKYPITEISEALVKRRDTSWSDMLMIAKYAAAIGNVELFHAVASSPFHPQSGELYPNYFYSALLLAAQCRHISLVKYILENKEKRVMIPSSGEGSHVVVSVFSIEANANLTPVILIAVQNADCELLVYLLELSKENDRYKLSPDDAEYLFNKLEKLNPTEAISGLLNDFKRIYSHVYPIPKVTVRGSSSG